MSTIAELILEGVLCQECGVAIDEDDWPNADKMACGYPRYCFDCGGDPNANGAAKRRRSRTRGRNRAQVK